jgi:hypothetical protein
LELVLRINVAFIAYLFLKVNVQVQPCFFNRRTEFVCAITSRIWHYTIVPLGMLFGSVIMTWIWFWIFDWTREYQQSIPQEPIKYNSLDSFDFKYMFGRIVFYDVFDGLKSTVGVMTAGPASFVTRVKHLAIENGNQVYCESFL